MGALFLACWVGQALSGWGVFNEEQLAHGNAPVGFLAYLATSHFLEATAENWESEFFQMAMYVLFTVSLFQKGSVESKDPDGTAEVDREPDPNREGAPWPVRRGGIWLSFYKRSLSIVLILLFVVSFALHAIGGASVYSNEQVEHGQSPVSAIRYLTTSRFWFESLQNWQSEFLAVLAIVVLSIHLRQQGSPESKPVDAPHRETGE